MSDKVSLGHTFLKGLRRLVDPPSGPFANVSVAADSASRYGVKKYIRRNLRNEPTMVDPSDVKASEAVRHAADERIRLEAIRQLDSVNLDDEEVDGRVDPLPEFDSAQVFTNIMGTEEPAKGDDATWDEVLGRFLSENDVDLDRG